MADTTSTFSVLLRLRDELSAALQRPITGMTQLQVATKGSVVILDNFGRPVQAAGAALENVGKKAAELGNQKLADLRKGATAASATMVGLLGATQALPPGLSAAASGVNGLLGAIASGFGPLGIAVAAISTVAGLAYALSNQLTPAARTAEEALKTTASAAERLANTRLDMLGETTKTLAVGADQELAATRQRLELAQRLDQARLSARAATVRADTSLSDEERAARLAAEDLAQRIEAMRAQLELAREEEALAQGRLDTLQQIVAQQKEQAIEARAAAAGFARQRETVDADLTKLRQARASASSSSSSGIPVATPELDAEIARLERLRGAEGEAEQQRLERIAKAKTEAAAALKTELRAATEAYDRTRIARTQLEAAAPDILAAQASEIHAANAAQQEQLSLAARQRARQEDQLGLDRQLAEISLERARIESDRLIGAEEKQRLLNEQLDRENALLQAKLDKLDAIIAAEKDPALRLELTRDRDQTAGRVAGNRGERVANTPLGVRDQVGADLVAITDAWGTSAERAAQLFSGPIKAALDAAHSGMQRLLGTTEFWTKKLGSVAGPIMGAVTEAISAMVTQWIAGQVRSFALEKVFRTQRKADVAAETALNATNAGLASIASFGTAAAVGTAALLAGMAAIGSFEIGGFTSGQRGRPAGLVHGEEFVFSADAVDALGVSFLEQMHSAATSGTRPAAAAPTGSPQPSPRGLSVTLVDNRSEARRVRRNATNEDFVVEVMRRRKYEILRPS